MNTLTREQVGYASTEESCRLIDVVGHVAKEYTDCAIVYTITNDQVRKLIALSRAELESTLESLRQQLAECQATNGNLLKALETIKQYLRSGNATAAYNYIFVVLTLPNDATALNELIAERTKELTAEVERLNTVVRSWHRANATGGWIDDFRKQYTELTAQRDGLLDALRLIEPSLKFSGWENAYGEEIGTAIDAAIANCNNKEK